MWKQKWRRVTFEFKYNEKFFDKLLFATDVNVAIIVHPISNSKKTNCNIQKNVDQWGSSSHKVSVDK